MSERSITSYAEFWPHYLREHGRSRTVAMQYIGTALVLAFAVLLLSTGNLWWLLATPLAGYGFAQGSHALVGRNRPATFTLPLWSLISDFRMFFLAVTGRLNVHLARAGVEPSR